jgi:hypothetical protein
MSWPLIKEVYATTPGLDPSAKAVLLALAFHANRDGVAWPRLGILQDDTGLTERTIERALDRLASTALVQIIHNPGRPSSYLVTPVTVTGVTPVIVTGGPVTVSGAPVTVTGGRRTGHEVVNNAPSPGSASRPAAGANGSAPPPPVRRPLSSTEHDSPFDEPDSTNTVRRKK